MSEERSVQNYELEALDKVWPVKRSKSFGGLLTHSSYTTTGDGTRARTLSASTDSAHSKKIMSQYEQHQVDYALRCAKIKYNPADERAVLLQVKIFAPELAAEGASRLDLAARGAL